VKEKAIFKVAMDFTIPECVSSTPLAPVALVGLNVAKHSDHAGLWTALTMDRAPERVPLRFFVVDSSAAASFPTPKPPRSSYEWFIPKGIIKTNWMNKHLKDLPAVVVVFFELDWNDPDWNEKKLEVAGKLESLRSTLAGRGTKMAVVLIQKEPTAGLPTGSNDDTVAAERASALCSACELSQRSLFVLPLATPNLQGFVVRLENAFYELAQNYYHQEIRGIKAHRDYLNKTTHLYLFVRHQFKIGFLNELKRDIHTAYKHYTQAYNLLMEVRATDTNIVEVKTVAGFINYKVCRLAFKLHLPRDAINQFRRHMDIFQLKVGASNLAFEHSAWQAEQCKTFAEIFDEAIRTAGLPAIQTQHPGLYFQQAAQYSIKRRQLTDELCGVVSDYPDPDPLANSNAMEFYGQRPWRPGKVAIEPPEMQLENEGIKALQFREKNLDPNHSHAIVELLRKATLQYQMFRSPRSESHLTVQMAEELKFAGKYEEALDLLRPVIQTYRSGGWNLMLQNVLGLALKCAYLVNSTKDYFEFAMELATLLCEEDTVRISVNLGRILKMSGAPDPEPGLTSKSERGAIGSAALKWAKLEPEEARVTLDPAADCLVKVRVLCDAQSSFRANEKVQLSLLIKYAATVSKGQQLDPMQITHVKVFSSDGSIRVDSPTNLSVEPSSTSRSVFEFSPTQEDVTRGRVGMDKVELTLHQRVVLCYTLGTDRPENVDKNKEFFPFHPKPDISKDETDTVELDLDDIVQTLSAVNIEQRQPQLKMSLEADAPILIGEWFLIRVKLENGEPETLSDVKVVARLKDASDPIIADTTRLTLDYNAPVTTPGAVATPSGETKEFTFAAPPVSHTIPTLATSGSFHYVDLYLKASTSGARGVEVKASYNVEGYKCVLTASKDFDSVEPFEVSHTLTSLKHGLPLTSSSAFTDEPFLILPQIKSLSPHDLLVLDSWLEPRAPVRFVGEGDRVSQLSGVEVTCDAICQECHPLVVNSEDLPSSCLDVQDLSLGKYVIKWRRMKTIGDQIDNEDSESNAAAAVSDFDMKSVKVTTSSIYVSAQLPSYGVVRTPMHVRYELTNRTDKVQEFSCLMQPSEAFMFSGNKQHNMKVLPMATCQLDYVLYPLLAGESVSLPQLKLTSVRLAQLTEDLEVTLKRLLPRKITVLPRNRSAPPSALSALTSSNVKSKSSATMSSKGSNVGKFHVSQPYVMECKPFATAVKQPVKS